MSRVIPDVSRANLHARRSTPEVILHIILGLVVLCTVFKPVGLLLRGMDYHQILSAYVKRDVVQVVDTVFLVGCVGALLRRSWALHLVRVSALWRVALVAFTLPHLFRGLASSLGPRPKVSPVLQGLGFTTPDILSVWTSVIYLSMFFGYTLIVIIASRVLAAYKSGQRMRTEPGTQVYSKWVFIVSIIAVYAVAVFRWIEHVCSDCSSDLTMVVTTYILLAATIVAMTAQCFLRDYFLTTSAITMALVSVNLPILADHLAHIGNVDGGDIVVSCAAAVSVSSWETLLMWAPMLIVGGMAVFSKRFSRRIRIASLAIPISLMLIAPQLLGGFLTVD